MTTPQLIALLMPLFAVIFAGIMVAIVRGPSMIKWVRSSEIAARATHER
jgi:hypothetical protein